MRGWGGSARLREALWHHLSFQRWLTTIIWRASTQQGLIMHREKIYMPAFPTNTGQSISVYWLCTCFRNISLCKLSIEVIFYVMHHIIGCISLPSYTIQFSDIQIRTQEMVSNMAFSDFSTVVLSVWSFTCFPYVHVGFMQVPRTQKTLTCLWV